MNNFNLPELILDQSPDIVYLSDIDTYQMYYINKTLHAQLGYPTEEVWKNTPCYKLIQNREQPCEFCTNHLLKTDTVHTWTHFNEAMQTWYALKDKKIELDGKNIRLEIAHDATEAMLAKQELNELAEEETILVACAGLLHTSNVPEKALQKLLDLIRSFYNAERSYIFAIDKDKKIVTNSHEARKKSVDTHLNSLRSISLKFFSFFIETLSRQNILYIDDIDQDIDIKRYPYAYDLLKSNNVFSLIVVPLTAANGEVVGFFGVDNPRAKLGSKDLLKQVSYFVSDFQEKQQLFDKLNELSYIDSMSGLHNTHKYIEDLNKYQASQSLYFGVIYIDMNGLKVMNDTIGHEAGNKLIITLGSILSNLFKNKVYRTGGDEFIALLPNMNKEHIDRMAQEIQLKTTLHENLTVAIGTAWTEEKDYNIKELVHQADANMYKNKREYYSKNGLDRRKER